jgi:polyhydroxyalkanoate synthesis regulator phasin
MTSNDLIKRLIDAGLSFTQMSQAKAEEIAKDLQEAGQLRVDEAQATVQELMARGRENTENLVRLVQREVSKQLETMGVDLSDLEARVEDLAARIGFRTPGGGSSASAGASSAMTTAATTGTAKKTTARRSTAKKSTAKRSTAKKTAAKKTTAKRAPAKRSTAKKSTAKKTAAKKTTAKKAASR